MLKTIATLSLIVLSCAVGRAGGTTIYSMMSPKLKKFLAHHPDAAKSLSNVVSEAFSNRTVYLNYFYTDDESVPRASHYYPDDSTVEIVIRENQQPCDQCFCLIYEMLNSEGEKQFQNLLGEAESGTISKEDFAEGVSRQEFKAVLKMQELLRHVKLNKAEIAKSHYYSLFIRCPNTFEAFLTYSKKASTHRDPIAFYEWEYDYLRQSTKQSNATLKPMAIVPSVSTNK